MRYRLRRVINMAMLSSVTACSILAVGLMFLIVGYIGIKGAGYVVKPSFYLHEPVPIGQTGGGISHAIVGTAILTTISAVIALPLGIAAGVYLSEYAGRDRLVLRFIADTLTGVPSIVVGLFVYAFLVIHTGFSALSGGVALAVIMLPIVTRTTEEALYLVPRDQREAALALGSPKWRVVAGVVIPGASPTIVTGCLLATARAAGETAPLIFTAFGNNFKSTDINGPVAAIPLVIFKYAQGPYKDQHDQAWAAAFVLVMLMLVLSALTRFAVSRRVK